MRVATWNIHGGIGIDGRFDLDRVVNSIAALDADLWALQEVESRATRVRGIDCFDVLRASAGGHAVAARTLRSHEGDYGHVLAASAPIERVAIHDVSHPGREPRHLIDGRIAGTHEALRVIAVHLDLGRRARRAQLALLRSLVEQEPDQPCIVLGDFNTPRAGTPERFLAPLLHPVPSAPTFPARWPVLRLDRLWCRPAALVRNAVVPRTQAIASDHLPVIAEIDTTIWDPPARPDASGQH